MRSYGTKAQKSHWLGGTMRILRILIVLTLLALVSPAVAGPAVSNSMTSMGLGNVVWIDVASLATANGVTYLVQITCYGWQPNSADREEISRRLERAGSPDRAFQAVNDFLTKVANSDLQQSHGERGEYLVLAGNKWVSHEELGSLLAVFMRN